MMPAEKATSSDLLSAIVAATRRSVGVRAGREPIEMLAQRAEACVPRPGRLRAALSREGVNVIAECKRRSPARGVLRASYDPVALALAYQHSGAAAVSVLTEPTFFDGSLAHLQAVRAAVTLPLLRKDFIVSEYQLLEARAAGADAVLLIVAAIDGATLGTLAGQAMALGLDTLVEVHDERELETALEAGASIIGVNNRNLRTLEVDVEASERLIRKMPSTVAAVSESGLKEGAELRRLAEMGYQGFLVGERLMTETDPGVALAALIRAAGAPHDQEPSSVTLDERPGR